MKLSRQTIYELTKEVVHEMAEEMEESTVTGDVAGFDGPLVKKINKKKLADLKDDEVEDY
jgi:hypothetical protein